jgi:hypothetical protein
MNTPQSHSNAEGSNERKSSPKMNTSFLRQLETAISTETHMLD